MKRIKLWIITLAIAMTAGGGLLAVTSTTNVSAAGASCSDDSFLGLPAWYRGVTDANCEVAAPTDEAGLSKFIWQIVLNVIDILLRLVGYVAVAFLIYGGFLFMTSQSSTDGVVKARKTITNAIIGLVISMASVAVINFIIGGLLK